MTVNTLQHGPAGIRSHDHHVLALIIFVPCFFTLLCAGAVARLLAPVLRSPTMRFAEQGSLISAARTGAYDCVAFALMG